MLTEVTAAFQVLTKPVKEIQRHESTFTPLITLKRS